MRNIAIKGKYTPILVPEMQDAYDSLDMVHEGGDAIKSLLMQRI